MNKNYKIAVIEDNTDVRENIEELLQIAHYQVVTARNGKEGVKICQKEKPDLIICDIMMPELDGYGVLHILSKSPDTARIPFLFLTAKTEKTDIRKGMSMGADDYILKPFDENDLLNAIEVRLKKNQLKENYDHTADGIRSFIADAKKVLLSNDWTAHNDFKTYKKKSFIFSEGETPTHIFYVQSGSVKISLAHPDGKELITNVHRENDFFGYEAVLEKQPYKQTATALEDTELMQIAADDFLTLLYARPNISLSFISLLCQKINEKENRLLQLAYNSVRQRTAEALLKLYDGTARGTHVSRDDLAKVVGTASESVIRILADFREEKLIQMDGYKIILLKPEGLKQVIRWNVAKQDSVLHF